MLAEDFIPGSRMLFVTAGFIGLSVLASAADARTFSSVSDSIAARDQQSDRTAALTPGSGDVGLSGTVDSRMWVPNGNVWSVVCDASTIYIGGEFTYVGPVTGGGAAIDASSSFVRQPYAKV